VGVWKQWYANAELRSEGEREPDAARQSSPRTGYWRFHFENGALEAQGVFVRGLREGHWDYHLTDGELDGDRTGEYHLDQILR
jgi:antitoxin component YwqK of YwqJK toxin-antitoxin module